MSSFYGRPSAKPKSGSQPQNRARSGAVRRNGGMGASVLPRKPAPRRRIRRALEDIYNETVEPYEPGVLLQERSPVTFSDPESLGSENEFCDLYGDHDGDDPFSGDHVDALVSTPSRGSNTGAHKMPDLRVLLQEQQTLLRTIISKQEVLEEKQSTFEQKLSALEEKVTTQSTTPSSSDTSPHGNKKRKRRVSRELSNLISITHKNIEKQLNPDEGSVSTHNSEVKRLIIQEISRQPNCKFSLDVIKVGVKRCYGNVRQSYMEGKGNYVEEQSKRRRYRARRQRIFDRRSLVVKESEKEWWLKLTYKYMTEESDDEDSNCIILHKIEWRSDILNKYIDSLDQRLAVVAAKDVPGNVAKKVRKTGEPSNSAPPHDAPAWVVRKPSGATVEGDVTTSVMNTSA